MQITINAEERDMLAETLTNTVANLRYEIGNTDSYDFKQGLKAKEVMLNRVIQELETAKVN